MLKISRAFIIVGIITLICSSVPAKSQVFRPQTAEEMEFAETHGFEMLPESPVYNERISGSLPGFLSPPLESPKYLEPTGISGFSGNADSIRVRRELAVLSSEPVVIHEDERMESPSMIVPKARLANWQSPVVPQPVQACTGVCVTYSSQGAAALKAMTGKRIKGFQLVQANVCADHDTKFGAGRIIQQANAMGIQTIGGRAGAAVVQQTVDLNWRKLLMIGVQVGTSVALGVTTSGVVASSKAITTGIALGHIAMDELPNVLRPGTPNPDPFLSSVLDEGGQVNLAAGACVSTMFAGTWDKNSPRVTGKIQLLP